MLIQERGTIMGIGYRIKEAREHLNPTQTELGALECRCQLLISRCRQNFPKRK